MCSSIFLVMGTALERWEDLSCIMYWLFCCCRYLAVCRPHHYRNVNLIIINYFPGSIKIIFLDSRQTVSLSRLHHTQLDGRNIDEHSKVIIYLRILGQNLIKMREILVKDWKLKYTLQLARWLHLSFCNFITDIWCSPNSPVQTHPLHIYYSYRLNNRPVWNFSNSQKPYIFFFLNYN